MVELKTPEDVLGSTISSRPWRKSRNGRGRGIVRCEVDRGQLVVERAVATVGREAADDGVDHLNAGVARCLEQPSSLRHRRARGHGVERMVGAALGMVGIEAGLEPDPLHVDQEKGGLATPVGRIARRQGGGDGSRMTWLQHRPVLIWCRCPRE